MAHSAEENQVGFLPPSPLHPQLGFLSRDLMRVHRSSNSESSPRGTQGPGREDKSLRGVQGRPFCLILNEPPFHLNPIPSFLQE